jgi:hypothetical protein
LNRPKRLCETGPRRENAFGVEMKPGGRGKQRKGGFQETHTYQALNDSGNRRLRRFA